MKTAEEILDDLGVGGPQDDDQGEDPGTDETGRRPWQPVDLGPVLDGTWNPPEPTVGSRTDGAGLFYPGKLHTVISETEGGKTWFALSAVIDEMSAGRHVVYLDFEDDEGGIVGRLLTLGVDREVVRCHFHYMRPNVALGTGINLDDLRTALTTYQPTLTVIDGITEAMTVHGLDPLKNADVAAFGRMLPRRLTEAGTAVASLDHVTKDREGRGKYAIGAVHKLNGLDGASYILENRTPFGVGMTGKSTIKIAKDRPGRLRGNGLPSSGGLVWYGDLILTSHDDDFAEVAIEPPHEKSADWRPTILMQRISDALAERGALSQRKIRAAVPGNNKAKIEALDYLILDGYVGEKSPHELLKPYTGGDAK